MTPKPLIVCAAVLESDASGLAFLYQRGYNSCHSVGLCAGANPRDAYLLLGLVAQGGTRVKKHAQVTHDRTRGAEVQALGHFLAHLDQAAPPVVPRKQAGIRAKDKAGNRE